MSTLSKRHSLYYKLLFIHFKAPHFRKCTTCSPSTQRSTIVHEKCAPHCNKSMRILSKEITIANEVGRREIDKIPRVIIEGLSQVLWHLPRLDNYEFPQFSATSFWGWQIKDSLSWQTFFCPFVSGIWTGLVQCFQSFLVESNRMQTLDMKGNLRHIVEVSLTAHWICSSNSPLIH